MMCGNLHLLGIAQIQNFTHMREVCQLLYCLYGSYSVLIESIGFLKAALSIQ